MEIVLAFGGLAVLGVMGYVRRQQAFDRKFDHLFIPEREREP